MDGSEARGSSNATIIVKYGTYSGLAKFIVWMPEFPLEVSVTDFRLSQIKGWKIPDDMHAYVKIKYFFCTEFRMILLRMNTLHCYYYVAELPKQ